MKSAMGELDTLKTVNVELTARNFTSKDGSYHLLRACCGEVFPDYNKFENGGNIDTNMELPRIWRNRRCNIIHT